MCPRAGLPDFYTMKLAYGPKKRVMELKASKLYLFSFRNVGIYHEELINEVFEDFKRATKPRWLFIRLKVNSRGEINTIVKRYWSGAEGCLVERNQSLRVL
ncbi:MAG: hypothetical protein JRN26_08280 [Nitrososphaerota archaeon]|nr:hypothetical protein [Nitrososphaerota archaeon]